MNNRTFTADIFGHPTDFHYTTKVEDGKITIKVETVFPAMRWDGRQLCTYAPPRYPWNNDGARLVDKAE